MNFKEFIQQQDMMQPMGNPVKPWKAKKADVLKMWQDIRPGLPIEVHPVEKGHSGTRFSEDGIRITGSPAFINSVLSHLKDLLRYNSTPGAKLDVEYREIQSKDLATPGKKVYVFYVHVVQDEPDFDMPEPKVP